MIKKLPIFIALAIAVLSEQTLADGHKKIQSTAADPMTTSAIDVAAKYGATRVSRVPVESAIEIAFAPLPQRSAEMPRTLSGTFSECQPCTGG